MTKDNDKSLITVRDYSDYTPQQCIITIYNDIRKYKNYQNKSMTILHNTRILLTMTMKIENKIYSHNDNVSLQYQ